MRLLLLEDDIRLAGLLRRGLQAEGHAVDTAASVEDGRWLATVPRTRTTSSSST